MCDVSWHREAHCIRKEKLSAVSLLPESAASWRRRATFSCLSMAIISWRGISSGLVAFRPSTHMSSFRSRCGGTGIRNGTRVTAEPLLNLLALRTVDPHFGPIMSRTIHVHLMEPPLRATSGRQPLL